jgi:hypothetical protein
MTVDATQSAASAIDTTEALCLPQPILRETSGYSVIVFETEAYLSDDTAEQMERLRELYCILGPEAVLEIRQKASALCERKIAQYKQSLSESGISDDRLFQSPTAAIALWEQRQELVVAVTQDIIEQELAALHWFEGLLIRIAKVDSLHHERLLTEWWEERYQISQEDSEGRLIPIKLNEATNGKGLRITSPKNRGTIDRGSGSYSQSQAAPADVPEVVEAAFRLGVAYSHWKSAVKQHSRRRRMDSRLIRSSFSRSDFPAPEALRTLREARQRYNTHGIIFSIYRDLIKVSNDMIPSPQVLRKIETAVIEALIAARDEGQKFVDRLDRYRIFDPKTIERVQELPSDELNSVAIIEQRYSILRLLMERAGERNQRPAQLAAVTIGPLLLPLGASLVLDSATAFWDAPFLQERLITRARLLAELIRQELTDTESALGKGPKSDDGVPSSDASGAPMQKAAAQNATATPDPHSSADMWTRADLEDAIGHLKYALLSDEEVSRLTPDSITATLNTPQLPDAELLRWAFMPGTLTCRAVLEGNIRTKAILNARTDLLRSAQRRISWVALAASAIPVVGEGAWVVAGFVDIVIEGVLAPQELQKYLANRQLNALTLDALADASWISPNSAEVPLILAGAGISVLGLIPGTGMVKDAATGAKVYRLSRAALEVAAAEVMSYAVTAAIYLGVERD